MSEPRRPRIAVVNHQAANIHSVAKALELSGADTRVTVSADELLAAEGAVLPGVGAADAALRAIDELGFREPIRAFIASGRPMLCVCVGMQILFESSEEGKLPGLGILEGTVRRFDLDGGDGEATRLKVPHMGWNSVRFTGAGSARHPAFAGVSQGSYFYFVHSYHCVPEDRAIVAGTTEYGSEVCAVIVRGELIATQFHPEKSGDLGLRIYRNFVQHVADRAAAATR